MTRQRVQRRRRGPHAVATAVGRPFLVVLALIACACEREAPREVEVEVRNVGFDYDAGVPVVILQSHEDAEHILPIWIGPAEAQAIAMEMQHVTPPRPLTHDLMKQILEKVGAPLRRVRITALEGQTFVATLVLVRDSREVEIDSRPSDAIALALRFRCPILVERALFDHGTPSGAAPGREASFELWGLTLQDVTPALAETLGLPDVAGVLVSDVEDGERASMRPQRGDVIVAVDDTPVADLEGLRALAASVHTPKRIEVRCGTERIMLAPSRALARADEE